MECILNECQWNGQNRCCLEDEQMREEAIPNNLQCPHFHDFLAEMSANKNRIIDDIADISNKMDVEFTEQSRRELLETELKDLLHTYDMAYDTYIAYLKNKLRDGEIV